MDFFYVKCLHDSGKKHSRFVSDNNNSLSGLDVKLILEINKSLVCARELKEYAFFFPFNFVTWNQREKIMD